MSETLKFREKPKEIEARLFDGETADLMAVLSWIQSNGYVWFDMFTPAPARGVTIDPDTGFLTIINSKREPMSAHKGDWIVKDVTGDIQPMPAEEFTATYEQIEEAETSETTVTPAEVDDNTE